MGRYSVGQRVWNSDGDICEVVGKPKKGVRELRLMGGNWDGAVYWADKSSLEPVTACPETSENAYSGGATKWISGQFVNTTDGDTAVVESEVDDVDHVWVRHASGQRTRLPASWLTAWVPKVGDRVRFKIDNPNGGANYGKAGQEAVVRADSGTSGMYGRQFELEDFGCGFPPDAPVSALEPVVAPATWTPMVGKFGKTRDGRKVGPLRRGEQFGFGGPWLFKTDTHYYQADGTSCRGNNGSDTHPEDDLVAEWVEPAVVAVAEATATVEVKAGETWRGKSGALHTVEANPDNGYWVLKTAGLDHSHDDVRFWKANGEAYNNDGWNPNAAIGDPLVELVSLATPPAKFKVGDRVVIKDVSCSELTVATRTSEGVMSLKHDSGNIGPAWWRDAELELAPTLPIHSTVTFTATGRLSAINDNGHMQVTFPGLPAGRNSFALPAEYVSAA